YCDPDGMRFLISAYWCRFECMKTEMAAVGRHVDHRLSVFFPRKLTSYKTSWLFSKFLSGFLQQQNRALCHLAGKQSPILHHTDVPVGLAVFLPIFYHKK